MYARTAAGCLLATLMLSAVPPAFAQKNVRTVEDLARQADVIAIGKVTATRSGWDQSHNRIITSVTVNVGEYLKGKEGNDLTITTLGGEVNGVGEWYSHMARFKAEEEVVVFANRDREGKLRISGGEEGKMKIERDSKTGAALVQGNRTLADLKKHVSESLQNRGGK